MTSTSHRRRYDVMCLLGIYLPLGPHQYSKPCYAYDQLQADVATDFSELRIIIFTNAQSIDRICNERSHGVAYLKSDIKLLKPDVKSLLDEPIFSTSVTSLDECINKVSAFDKRLNRLAKHIQGEPA